MTLSLATVTPLVSTAAAAMHAGVGATDAKRIAIADPSATIALRRSMLYEELLSLVRLPRSWCFWSLYSCLLTILLCYCASPWKRCTLVNGGENAKQGREIRTHKGRVWIILRRSHCGERSMNSRIGAIKMTSNLWWWPYMAGVSSVPLRGCAPRCLERAVIGIH